MGFFDSVFRPVRWAALCAPATVCVLGCGEDSVQTAAMDPEDLDAVEGVMSDRWRGGYMTEDLELYMSAFWAEGFLYINDLGTPSDASDDLIIDNIAHERDAADRVFRRFRGIEIDLFEPWKITALNEEQTRCQAANHYRIRLTEESSSFTITARGYHRFILERRPVSGNSRGEWRIVEWYDAAQDASSFMN